MMTLYGYWRSSSSYRVRIALALKGIEVHHISINLGEGIQQTEAHMARNSQAYVPVLELENGTRLTQSLAIIDYLDRAYPERHLIPKNPLKRAKVMAASLVIAADIQPVQNLSIFNYLREVLEQGEDDVKAWARHWISQGLTSLEVLAKEQSVGPFFAGKMPGLFECCLIPQIYNARRFGLDMSRYPVLAEIDKAASVLPAFIHSAPKNQTDAQN